LKILVVNKYLYNKGGAERSMFSIASLFESKGHEIAYFSMHDPKNIKTSYNKYFISNIDYFEPSSFLKKIKNSIKIIYNRDAVKKFGKIVSDFKPDLIHSHNIYHQLTPAIYSIAKKHHIPVIQFLHDLKIVCPVYLFISNGRICDGKCRYHHYYWCTIKRCNRNSIIKSLVNTIEMYFHNVVMKYYNMVDLFISPSNFLTRKVISMGFSPDKIVTLPHFAKTENITPNYSWKNREIIYFGRVANEKGIGTLISAVRGLNIALKIIGDGPEKNQLIQYTEAHKIENVTFLPHLDSKTLLNELLGCMFTVLPSIVYENCPNAVIESFLCGKPVIGADIGGIPEMIRNLKTGLTFIPGDSEDLRKKIVLLSSDPQLILTLGKNARHFIENERNIDQYYQKISELFEKIC
jgi:glycosyltransferase involved in cell wall biosynthesis